VKSVVVSPEPTPAPVEEPPAPKPSPLGKTTPPAPVRQAPKAAAVAPPVETPAAPAAARPARAAARGGDGWTVVVAAYNVRDLAEKRARDLAKRWKAFQVEVVEAPSEKVRLLVVIGKNLSQDQADALRRRAVSSGMPRDTYIKRISVDAG